MSVTFKMDGLADLEKALFELGSTSTARRVGQRALMQGAVPMVQRARANAPDDPRTALGLKEAVAAKPSNRNRSRDTAEVIIGIDWNIEPARDVPRKRRRGTYRDPGVGGNAVMQEFGTVKMKAQPFMRPAFDAEAENTIARVGEALAVEIQKSAARLAKRRAKKG